MVFLFKSNAFRLFGRVNAYALSVLSCVLKFNGSVDQSKECVIRSDADILAGVDVSASLSYDDVACKDLCTVSLLDAKTLRFRVSAVLSRTDTFFMSKELQTDSQHTSGTSVTYLSLILRLR